jgi:negative regulator of flagellin synthesis FlgM
MKIQPNDPQQTTATGLSRVGSSTPASPPATRPVASPSGSGSDPAVRVELSGRARELHAALVAANAAPDVRTEKVAAAKAKVDAGTYSVDANVVARRMLDVRA